jgi:hypothetical protein
MARQNGADNGPAAKHLFLTQSGHRTNSLGDVPQLAGKISITFVKNYKIVTSLAREFAVS